MFALVGRNNSGKTLLFSALTGIEYKRLLASGARKTCATIRIKDPRLEVIRERVGGDKRIVYPLVELVDTISLRLDGDTQGNRGILAGIREAEGLILVIRLFDLGDKASFEQICHLARQEISKIKGELMLSDLDIIERRVTKLKELSKRPAQFREEHKRELEILTRLLQDIPEDKTQFLSTLSQQDSKRLAGFQFFAQKPMMVILNIGEQSIPQLARLNQVEGLGIPVVALAVRLEAELCTMEEDERLSFMQGYGLSELSIAKLALKIYHSLGFKIFFTIGRDEVAGWGLKGEASAIDAAGKIHTDMAKGFISGEVISYEDWLAHGRARLEGKDYRVVDGDIIQFKFSV
jgi:hypothetical protein